MMMILQNHIIDNKALGTAHVVLFLSRKCNAVFITVRTKITGMNDSMVKNCKSN